MTRKDGVVELIREHYETTSDREMAKLFGVCYATVFNIRKQYGLERTDEFNHHRHVLSGIKGGTNTHRDNDTTGQNNSNWKGGISKNKRHYKKI